MENAAARRMLAGGALAGAAGVLCGAFGAHALRGLLDARALDIWRTAVDYQFWHALALLACGLLARGGATRGLRTAGFAFASGIVVFCGSLYALALGAPRAFGMVTPFGGVAFIVGWLTLAAHAWRFRGA